VTTRVLILALWAVLGAGLLVLVVLSRRPGRGVARAGDLLTPLVRRPALRTAGLVLWAFGAWHFFAR
jgi:hypothetical protein